MSTFEKLFVNSTNRISAVRNIILSQSSSINFDKSEQFTYDNKNPHLKLNIKHIQQQQIYESYQQLQQKYQEISKTLKEASKQKQMMTMLFDKIFLIQQGANQKIKKRFRRKKNEIQAKYQCSVSNCNKIYTSSTSLARHAKLKHSYTCSQPPQHNYQIPPQPNLTDSSQISKRQETLSDVKSLSENDEDQSDANACQFQSMPFDNDQNSSKCADEQMKLS